MSVFRLAVRGWSVRGIGRVGNWIVVHVLSCGGKVCEPVRACVRARARARVCVCACARGRANVYVSAWGRDRDRQTDRQTGSQRPREAKTARQRTSLVLSRVCKGDMDMCATCFLSLNAVLERKSPVLSNL